MTETLRLFHSLTINGDLRLLEVAVGQLGRDEFLHVAAAHADDRDAADEGIVNRAVRGDAVGTGKVGLAQHAHFEHVVDAQALFRGEIHRLDRAARLGLRPAHAKLAASNDSTSQPRKTRHAAPWVREGSRTGTAGRIAHEAIFVSRPAQSQENVQRFSEVTVSWLPQNAQLRRTEMRSSSLIARTSASVSSTSACVRPDDVFTRRLPTLAK